MLLTQDLVRKKYTNLQCRIADTQCKSYLYLTHDTESQKSIKRRDRKQITSKANFSKKIPCIRYTEFVRNAIAEGFTGSQVIQRKRREKGLESILRINLEHVSKQQDLQVSFRKSPLSSTLRGLCHLTTVRTHGGQSRGDRYPQTLIQPEKILIRQQDDNHGNPKLLQDLRFAVSHGNLSSPCTAQQSQEPLHSVYLT